MARNIGCILNDYPDPEYRLHEIEEALHRGADAFTMDSLLQEREDIINALQAEEHDRDAYLEELYYKEHHDAEEAPDKEAETEEERE